MAVTVIPRAGAVVADTTAPSFRAAPASPLPVTTLRPPPRRSAPEPSPRPPERPGSPLPWPMPRAPEGRDGGLPDPPAEGSSRPRKSPRPVQLPCSSWPYEILEVGETPVADAVDLAQLVDGTEPSVLGAVVDDVLGQHRSDARQCVELLCGSGVEPDRPRSRGPGSGPRPGRTRRTRGTPEPIPPGAAGTPTTTCSPSASSRARLIPVGSTPGRIPPAARNASATLDPAGSRWIPGLRTFPLTSTTIPAPDAPAASFVPPAADAPAGAGTDGPVSGS